MERAAPETALRISLESGFAEALDRAAEAAHPAHRFLRRAWFAAAGGRSPRTLVAARADGQVVAALPTVSAHTKLAGLRAVGGGYWPFRSFPVAEDASEAELAAILACPAAGDVLGWAWRLGPVLRGDPTAARVVRAASQVGFTILERRVATTYALDIAAMRADGPWPRASTLRNLHKQEKRLARLGELDWRIVGGSGWTAKAFDALQRIEANSWVGSRKDADAKFLAPALRRGWEEIARDPILAGMMSAGILSIGREPAAFSFGIDCGSIRHCIATSYDQRFARHSPGYVTGYRTYMAAAERGIEVLNLGAGDSGEKSSMGATPAPELIDLLFVRSRPLAGLLRPFWRRSGK